MNDANHQTYKGFSGISRMRPSELATLISLLPDRGYMLEIGSADGVTAAMIARAKPQARIVSLDHYMGDWGKERLQNWNANKQPNQILWLGEIDTFFLFCPRKFDVVLVDCNHDFRCVLSDLNYASMLTSVVIAAHDYHEPDFPGVKEAVDRFLEEHTELKMELVATLAVLRKKP